jgi:predicted permease
MDEIRQDIRYAFRSLARRPGFTVVALATLTLGIGVNAGMFSVLRAVLFEPLPYADAERLVEVGHADVEGGSADGLFSYPDFHDVHAATRSFTTLAAYWYAPGVSETTVTGTGEPANIESAFVSPDFFAALGVAPHVGRLPTPDEMTEGNDHYVVLSYAEWQSRFGGRPDALGSTVTIDGEPFTILGVMPPSFGYPAEAVRSWLPLSQITEESIPRERQVRYLSAIGRLAPGATASAAAVELTGITGRLAEQYSETNRGWETVRLQGLRDAVLGSVQTPLFVLAFAVGFVLLIACSNLVNLLLARASSRQSEFAVRAALGAGRSRMVRQLITESTVLAVIGGALGIVAASWLTNLVVGMGGADLPRIQQVRLDAPVILFALVLSVLAGVATGIVPAFRSAASAAGALREDGRGGTDGRQRQRLRGALVATEMALAVVLVIAAGLMVRSLTTLLRVDPGFEVAQVVGVSLRFPAHHSESLEQRLAYRAQLVDALEALPGVIDVGMAKSFPLEDGGEHYEFGLPGREPAVFAPEAGVMIVSPTYFAALGIPVRRGRTFDEREVRDSEGQFGENFQLTMVINEAAARRYFPGEEALGQRLTLGEMSFEVVGVVGDVRHRGLHAEPVPAAYVPIDVMPRGSIRFMMRVRGEPAALIPAIRTTIRDLDPLQPIAAILPLERTVSQAAARERFLSTLLTAFAVMALALAAIGIYGVVAYGVSQRMREMGIRIALGALPGSVVGMIVRESAAWWGAGLLAGLMLALAGTRLLRSLVYGVSVTDPATYATVVLMLGSAALLASLLPALRASRADPTSAFR